MPEGHTVHRLAGTFTALFAGERVAVSSPQGRFLAGAALLDGRTVGRTEAFGKQMFVPFVTGGASMAERSDEGDVAWLRVHLGLYGAWTFAGDGSVEVVHAIGAPRRRVSETEKPLDEVAGAVSFPPGPRGQVRVRVLGERAVADLTGPTACEVVTGAEKDLVVARLGPDPIRGDADPCRFRDAVGRSRAPVATMLMDQSVLAGVGNIYRAEALFRARLNPITPGSAVAPETVEALWDDVVVLMRDGVRTGRIVTTRPEDRSVIAEDLGTDGRLRPPRRGAARQNTDDDPDAVPRASAFYVYQRDGLPCRVCGTSIALRDLAGRKLYWCPSCQR